MMKKLIISTLAVIMLCLSANAATVAYWRLEEGPNGSQHNDDMDGYFVDTSGNGNNMSTWYRAVGITDVPFAVVPQTTEKNKASLTFFKNKTMTVGTYDSTKPIEGYNFTSGWTIEASIRHSYQYRNWQGAFSKNDTADPIGTPGDEPPFAFKVNNDNKSIMVIGCDDSGIYREIQSLNPLDCEKWYSLVATFEPTTSNLSFWVKSETDPNYILQGSINTAPAGFSIGKYGTSSWVVANSQWAEGAFNDYFGGSVDEVRISEGVLDPNQFLASTGGAAVTPLAYWRFEEGTNGAHNADMDNYYTDSSGNGNNMQTPVVGHGKSTATNDVPFATVPQTTDADTMARNFNGFVQNVGTFGYESSPKPVESNPFDTGFTVECMAKITAFGWRVIVGKDGYAGSRHCGWDNENFGIKFTDWAADGRRIQMFFWDGNTNYVEVTTTWNYNLDEWYRIAGVCVGGTQAMLYVMQESDSAYDLEAESIIARNISAGDIPVPMVGGLLNQTRSWTVGRGMHGSNSSDPIEGNVDEVRISDTALPVSALLGSVPEPGMILGGIVLALLAIRRK